MHFFLNVSLNLFYLPRPADGPYRVGISGGDILTVGVLYHFNCSVDCYPACLLTWTWGNVTSHGPHFSLQIEELIPPQLLTCTAVNPLIGVELAGEETMQVIGNFKKYILYQAHTFCMI